VAGWPAAHRVRGRGRRRGRRVARGLRPALPSASRSCGSSRRAAPAIAADEGPRLAAPLVADRIGHRPRAVAATGGCCRNGPRVSGCANRPRFPSLAPEAPCARANLFRGNEQSKPPVAETQSAKTLTRQRSGVVIASRCAHRPSARCGRCECRRHLQHTCHWL
jgi:hypothetical protein